MEVEEQQGRQVGRYRLVERLAVGGMAEVFLAVERSEGGAASLLHGGGGPSSGPFSGGLERLVVVKRILPHLAQEQAFVDMFMTEARIVARIRHPNVVQIYELGEAGGLPFIAMEYVTGSTLKQLVAAARRAEVRLPTSVALHLVSQACAGAHAAHELADPQGKAFGLVHRDISPHNLMVDEHGHVKLLDFGIAKADGMDQTRTGLLKGKISYMAPEQCQQDALDRRADVFALGVVAWELLAGRKPFAGNSELATMQAIVTGDVPDLRKERPDVPEAVVVAVERALSVGKDDRPRTAEAFREELRDAVRGTADMPDSDAAARMIRTLLGDRHDRRQQAIEAAMERTLVSLSWVMPAPVGATGTGTHASTGGTTATSVEPSISAHNAVRTAGVVASLGAIVGIIGLFVALLALGIVVWVMWPEGEPAAAPPPTRPEGELVVVSVAPVLSPEELAKEHEPLRLYLEQALQRPVDLRVAPSYQRAARDVGEGDTPFAFLPQRTTSESAPEMDFDILAVKLVDGSTSTDGYLLVQRDGAVQKPEDIGADTVICYSDPLSNTGYKLPRSWLRAQGIDPDTLTERVSGNLHRVLVDLLEERCDLGGTHSGNYNTAGARGLPLSKLKLLATTGSTPHDAIVAGPASDDELKEAMREALLAFDPLQHAGVEYVGESERISGFAEPPPDYMRPLGD